MGETGYITMTRRQNNNQWMGSIADHPAPKNSKCKNPLENFSLRFSGIKKASSSWIIFQRAKLSPRNEYYSSLLVQLKDILKEKCRGAGRSPRGSCSCTTMLRLTWHLQPRRKWPTQASNVLIIHPILWFWPRRTTTCYPD